jgi:hypothetical protein
MADRTIRARVAPSAAWIAAVCSRERPRASSSVARLAHASSSRTNAPDMTSHACGRKRENSAR